jgi:peptidoglycan-associated lipoprotein
MKMYEWKLTMLAMLGLVLGASACGRKPAAEVPAPVQTPAPAPAEDADAAERAAREAAERAAAAARSEAERAREVLTAMVFFDFDVAEIRDDAKRALDAKLPVLRSDPGIRMRIEGHADERGSTEYNLALGSRRATSVASYLQAYGIDRSRFETVSWGEERPLASGAGEGAWARNRRAEFVITAGPSTIEGTGGEGR